MAYYYEPERYTEKMTESIKENMKGLGESIKERLKALEERIKKLEEKK